MIFEDFILLLPIRTGKSALNYQVSGFSMLTIEPFFKNDWINIIGPK
jgi:hypothetical protein